MAGRFTGGPGCYFPCHWEPGMGEVTSGSAELALERGSSHGVGTVTQASRYRMVVLFILDLFLIFVSNICPA